MLSKEREKELLDQYHRDKAQREKENAECQATIDNFHAIMSRNQGRYVTTKKDHPHTCCVCGKVVDGGSRMWFSPGRIAAVSSRNTDACFTASTYTCTSCKEKQ